MAPEVQDRRMAARFFAVVMAIPLALADLLRSWRHDRSHDRSRALLQRAVRRPTHRRPGDPGQSGNLDRSLGRSDSLGPRPPQRQRVDMADEFMQAAIDEARAGEREGGIPIGSVLVHRGRIIGRGHNRRVQRGSTVLHGEMDALENAGRQPAAVYRECVSVHDAVAVPDVQRRDSPLWHSTGHRRRKSDVRGRRSPASVTRCDGGSSPGRHLHRAHGQFHSRASRSVERGHRRIGPSSPVGRVVAT